MEAIEDRAEMTPVELWGSLLSLAASRFFLHLTKDRGLTEVNAKNYIIKDLLACAAREACRTARKEGRDPDIEKWRIATDKAFRAAVDRTKDTSAS